MHYILSQKSNICPDIQNWLNQIRNLFSGLSFCPTQIFPLMTKSKVSTKKIFLVFGEILQPRKQNFSEYWQWCQKLNDLSHNLTPNIICACSTMKQERSRTEAAVWVQIHWAKKVLKTIKKWQKFVRDYSLNNWVWVLIFGRIWNVYQHKICLLRLVRKEKLKLSSSTHPTRLVTLSSLRNFVNMTFA